MTKLKLFEAFAGIGAQAKSLKNIGVDFESVGVAEVDGDAIKSYAAVHADTSNVTIPSEEEMQAYMERLNIPLDKKGNRRILKDTELEAVYKSSVAIKNVGDISKVTEFPEMDLFTYSFPCQSISFAGYGHGLDRGSGTRSSLLWECERVIEQQKPKYLLMENVKALLSVKHKHNFDIWKEWLDDMGYNSYVMVLNAKHFGIPQNRERVFMVSIRKDVDNGYEIPVGHEIDVKISDFVDYSVEARLSMEKHRDIIERDAGLQQRIKNVLNGIEHEIPKNKIDGLGQVYASFRSTAVTNHESWYVQTLTTANQKVYLGGISKEKLYDDSDDLVNYFWCRELSSREYWRLMGFTDEDYDKAYQVTKVASLYRQAGNSIVVPVLEAIFTNLLKK
jgi:DNA (cytosine-5)-methyltransferase 1